MLTSRGGNTSTELAVRITRTTYKYNIPSCFDCIDMRLINPSSNCLIFFLSLRNILVQDLLHNSVKFSLTIWEKINSIKIYSQMLKIPFDFTHSLHNLPKSKKIFWLNSSLKHFLSFRGTYCWLSWFSFCARHFYSDSYSSNQTRWIFTKFPLFPWLKIPFLFVCKISATAKTLARLTARSNEIWGSSLAIFSFPFSRGPGDDTKLLLRKILSFLFFLHFSVTFLFRFSLRFCDCFGGCCVTQTEAATEETQKQQEMKKNHDSRRE